MFELHAATKPWAEAHPTLAGVAEVKDFHLVRWKVLRVALVVPTAVWATISRAECKLEGNDRQERIQAAEAVYVASGASNGFRMVVQQTLLRCATSIAQAGGRPTEDVRRRIQVLLIPDIEDYVDKAKQIFITAEADNLTVNDLDAHSLNKSPDIGVRLKAAFIQTQTQLHAEFLPLLQNCSFLMWQKHREGFLKLGLSDHGIAQ